MEKGNRCLMEAAKMGNPTAFIFLNKQQSKERTVIKQAAQLGSQDALKLLARTNTTSLTEARSIEQSKDSYGVYLNRMVKEVAKSNRP